MNLNLFALLDTGHPGVQHVTLHPADCFIRSRGLFEGTPEAALTRKGPWLATMTTYRGFDYRAFVAREYEPHGASALLSTPLSFDATFGHLRSHLHVRTASAGTALLRFWDAAVFHRLTYVLDTLQLASLVGPFDRWETSAASGTDYRWDASQHVEHALPVPPLTLTARQAGMLQLPLFGHVGRKLALEIWHGHPRACAGREPLDVLGAVQRAYRYSLEGLRLSDLRSIASWVRADAGWANGLHAQPSIAMRIGRARNPELSSEDVLAALKASARFKERT
ncbi:MAG: DUF4123 domain-containing protein [Luteibacter sp.]